MILKFQCVSELSRDFYAPSLQIPIWEVWDKSQVSKPFPRKVSGIWSVEHIWGNAVQFHSNHLSVPIRLGQSGTIRPTVFTPCSCFLPLSGSCHEGKILVNDKLNSKYMGAIVFPCSTSSATCKTKKWCRHDLFLVNLFSVLTTKFSLFSVPTIYSLAPDLESCQGFWVKLSSW